MNEVQLIELTKEFIQNATNYNMPYLEKIYADKLLIVMVDENDTVNTINKEQLIAFFQNRKDTNLAPLSGKSEFLYAVCDEKSGMVVVNREMSFNERPEKMFFTLVWEKTEIGWQVVKESSLSKPILD
jgi:hypothetical protein